MLLVELPLLEAPVRGGDDAEHARRDEDELAAGRTEKTPHVADVALRDAEQLRHVVGKNDIYADPQDQDLDDVLEELHQVLEGKDLLEPFAYAQVFQLGHGGLYGKQHAHLHQVGTKGHGHDHGEEKDEHVWLSLKNAKTLVGAIADALQELDPDNKDTYAANASAYIEKLSALDGAYQSAVDGAARKTVLFGDRFPFRYLVDDYGLHYYAAFAGCSAESEASFETVSFLAKKVDELGLPCVLTIEGAQHRIAETIVQNTAGKNQKVLTMDSMQSTTSKDVANGATYLSVMEKNLSVLKEALG